MANFSNFFNQADDLEREIKRAGGADPQDGDVVQFDSSGNLIAGEAMGGAQTNPTGNTVPITNTGATAFVDSQLVLNTDANDFDINIPIDVRGNSDFRNNLLVLGELQSCGGLFTKNADGDTVEIQVDSGGNLSTREVPALTNFVLDTPAMLSFQGGAATFTITGVEGAGWTVTPSQDMVDPINPVLVAQSGTIGAGMTTSTVTFNIPEGSPDLRIAYTFTITAAVGTILEIVADNQAHTVVREPSSVAINSWSVSPTTVENGGTVTFTVNGDEFANYTITNTMVAAADGAGNPPAVLAAQMGEIAMGATSNTTEFTLPANDDEDFIYTFQIEAGDHVLPANFNIASPADVLTVTNTALTVPANTLGGGIPGGGFGGAATGIPTTDFEPAGPTVSTTTTQIVVADTSDPNYDVDIDTFGYGNIVKSGAIGLGFIGKSSGNANTGNQNLLAITAPNTVTFTRQSDNATATINSTTSPGDDIFGANINFLSDNFGSATVVMNNSLQTGHYVVTNTFNTDIAELFSGAHGVTTHTTSSTLSLTGCTLTQFNFAGQSLTYVPTTTSFVFGPSSAGTSVSNAIPLSPDSGTLTADRIGVVVRGGPSGTTTYTRGVEYDVAFMANGSIFASVPGIVLTVIPSMVSNAITVDITVT